MDRIVTGALRLRLTKTVIVVQGSGRNNLDIIVRVIPCLPTTSSEKRLQINTQEPQRQNLQHRGQQEISHRRVLHIRVERIHGLVDQRELEQRCGDQSNRKDLTGVGVVPLAVRIGGEKVPEPQDSKETDSNFSEEETGGLLRGGVVGR